MEGLEGLKGYRLEINEIDEKIIELLGQRFQICRKVAGYKKENKIPMMQSNRVDEVKNRCADLGISHDIDPDFMRELYGKIIHETCRVEDTIIDAPESDGQT